MRDNDLFQLALGITSPWFVASLRFRRGEEAARHPCRLPWRLALHVPASDGLKTLVSVAGVDYRLITTDIAAVPTSELVGCVANLEEQRGVFIYAIDFLMQWFDDQQFRN